MVEVINHGVYLLNGNEIVNECQTLSAKIFCSRLPQSEIGYSTKKSLPIVWLTALLGCHLLKHVKRLR